MPDDVATPERMTPAVRAYYETKWLPDVVDERGEPDLIGVVMVRELLAELRAIEAQLAERDAEISRLRTALRDARAYMPTIIGNAQQVVADIIAALKEHDE